LFFFAGSGLVLPNAKAMVDSGTSKFLFHMGLLLYD
jgi:hypothetical protein